MDYKVILDRLDFNESRIREGLKDIKEIRKVVGNLKKYKRITEIVKSDDDLLLKILKSEKARIKLALELVKFKKDAAKLLGFSERTMYRKLKEYNLE